MSLRGRLVDQAPGSFAYRARSRRWAMLKEEFPQLVDMNVVDLGGTPDTWRQADVHPLHVTCVNLQFGGGEVPSWITMVEADACQASTLGHFDLVFSNSTIEHVGGHARRNEFVAVVKALAPHHWVQTPNRYFPVEPHFVFPAAQFLPTRPRAWIAEHWPLSNAGAVAGKSARECVLEIEVLSATELRHYFEESRIIRERVLGLTKSLIAVR